MTGVLPDPVAEVRRILSAAQTANIPLRAIGGLGIALRAPSVQRLRPTRTYHDIDLAGPSGRPDLARLLADLGYEPARRFNTLNGSERLLFHDPDGRRIDVFFDTLRMCHELRFRERLMVDRWTLSPADLALSKLQIVEATERDDQDVAALLADLAIMDGDSADGIALSRFRDLCGADWGWWRTVRDNLERLVQRWTGRTGAELDAESARVLSLATERARLLAAELDACPKSMAWRVRARVGRRVRWYDLPEEVR